MSGIGQLAGFGEKKCMVAAGFEPRTPSLGSRHAHHYSTAAATASFIILKGLYLLVYKNIYVATAEISIVRFIAMKLSYQGYMDRGNPISAHN